jgi:hypothetical protein
MMTFSRVVLAALSVVASNATTAMAGSFDVTASHGRYTVVAQDAAVDQILERLAKSSGITVERTSLAEEPDIVTGTFDGTLETVLGQFLLHENHMIEYGGPTGSAIVRVVIYGSNRTAAALSAERSTPVAAPRAPAIQRAQPAFSPAPANRQSIPQPLPLRPAPAAPVQAHAVVPQPAPPPPAAPAPPQPRRRGGIM